jgi:hypothetical protein
VASTLYKFVLRRAKWSILALLFVLFIVCSTLFTVREGVLTAYRSKEVGDVRKLALPCRVLDTRFCYSRQEAHEFLTEIGPSGRCLYGLTQLSLDAVFPACYGLLFAILIVRLYVQGWAECLLAAPLLTVLADWGENVTTAYLAFSWTEGVWDVPAATVAACFTVSKFVLILGTLLVVAWGGCLRWRCGELPDRSLSNETAR